MEYLNTKYTINKYLNREEDDQTNKIYIKSVLMNRPRIVKILFLYWFILKYVLEYL